MTIAQNDESKPVRQPDPDLYQTWLPPAASPQPWAAERGSFDLDVRGPVEGHER